VASLRVLALFPFPLLGLLISCGGAPQRAPSSPHAPSPAPSAAPAAAVATEEPDDNLHCGADAQRCATFGALALVSSNRQAEGRAMLEKGCTLGSLNACTNLGRALYNGVGGEADRPRAVGLWTKACVAGEGDACNAEGDASDADPPTARKAYERGCALDHKDSCANLGLMLAKGEGGPKDERAAATTSDKACKKGAPLGCLVFGVLARDGTGMPEDRAAAKAAFHTACQAGKRDGCAAEQAMSSRAEGGAPRKANVMSAESMTVDGMQLKELSCELGAGGPLGMLGVTAGLRARKAQLDACSPGRETETRVVLHAKGGRFAAVEAKGSSAAIGRCVERALVNQRSNFDGTCSSTLVHGRK
jgi:TPR repeat protein